MDSDPGGEYYHYYLDTLLLSIDYSNHFSFVIGVIVLCFLLVCSGLISGSEVAFFSMDQNDLEGIKKDNKTGNKIIQLLDQPKRLLATILIANNFINVAIIMLSTYLLNIIFSDELASWVSSALGEELGKAISFFFEVVLITFLLVLFGEVAPKVYAKKNNLKLAGIMARPLNFLSKVTRWPSSLLMKGYDALENKFKTKDGNKVTLEEIDHAIELTVKDTANANQEIELLKSIVKFGNVPVKQIMCARVDITAIDIEDKFTDVLKMIRESGYSRIPVYTEDLDTINGFLYAKDLLEHLDKKNDFNWQKIIRTSPFFIPESKKIDDLLKEFQAKRVHIAIVVDEFGGTAGLVTLEDVIEEIIGEIKDEFDDHIEVEYKKINDYNFLFEGKTMINDVCKLTGLDTSIFEEVRGDADSLGGLILEMVGRLPKYDEVINFENYSFKIVSVDKKRIRQVKVTLPDDI